MTKEEKFHQRFLHLGGVWPVYKKEDQEYLSPLDDLLGGTLDYANKTIDSIRLERYPKLPQINIHFIDNNEMNAVAGKDEYEEIYYIGIYVGSFFLLDDMFSKMMANKYVLTKIGDISKESDESKKLHIDQDFVSKIITFRNPESDNRSRVLDSVRYEFSQLCTGMVLWSLIFHECGHILRGHIDYSNNLNDYFFLKEFGNREDDKIPSSHRQTLEMDADSFALNIMYNTITHIIKNNIGTSLFNTNIEEFISNFSFALYSYYRLMGFGIVSNKEESTHPPAPYRIAMIYTNTLSLLRLSEYSSEEIAAFEKLIINSMQDAERAFLKVTYDTPKWDSFKECFSAESIRYVSDILTNWNNVRPLIEPFAYCELPPLQPNHL